MAERSGDTVKLISGYNPGVAGTEVDIRSDDASLAYNATAQALEIVSADVNDDDIPTGTLTLATVVPNTFSTGTIQSVSPVANTFSTGTLTFASALANDTVTINGLIYTAVSGTKSDNTEFSIDTSDGATGIDLVDSITNDVRAGTSGDVSATDNASGVVTITTDVAGTGGDAITLAESTASARITKSGATLSGGVAADTATVNGLVYTAVAGARANDTQFSTDTSDTAIATDLAAAITADTRTGTLGDTTATSSTDTVTITTTVLGTGGDAITLTSSSTATRLITSGTTFANGVTASTCTVNGLVYTGVAGTKAGNTQFSTDTNDTAAAVDLAASIAADTRTGVTVPLVDVTATSATTVVTIHSTTVGTAGNTIDIVGDSTITASAATLTDADTAGAWSVLVTGLNGSYAPISETVYLNGQIAVQLANTYIFVESAVVSTTGTSTFNQGLITVRITAGGATQITIPALLGKSQSLNYIVPLAHRAEIQRISCSISNDDTVANSATLRVYTRDLATSGAPWLLKESLSLSPEGQTVTYLDGELVLPPQTAVSVRAIRVSGAVDNIVNASYKLLLHKD